MSATTLYLVQSAFHQTVAHFETLQKIAQSNDPIVLMGEAVLHYDNVLLADFTQLYYLENESALINGAHAMKALSYLDFADLCLQHVRCVSLR